MHSILHPRRLLVHLTISAPYGSLISIACRLNYLQVLHAIYKGAAVCNSRCCRAADEAAKRTGAAIRPVYVVLDSSHSKPEDLQVAAGRTGSPSALVLGGEPHGLLACAERFKNQAAARQLAARPDEERKKKGKDMRAGGFVSDHGALFRQVVQQRCPEMEPLGTICRRQYQY